MPAERTKVARESNGDEEQRDKESMTKGVKSTLDQGFQFGSCINVAQKISTGDSGYAAKPLSAEAS